MPRIAVVLLSLAFCLPSFGQEIAPPVERETEPGIQLAILLDTSGSMSGLINQARTELWKVVNNLVLARRDGKLPFLQIALYEYGNSGLSAESGFIRQCSPFTDDLDAISEQLFGLTTNGGDEYCGWVIRDALEDLAWNESETTVRLIYIAGNEPFAQGPVDFTTAIALAKEKGVLVNTVHCEGGEDTGWLEASKLGDGSFISINMNQQVAHIPAPQDEEMVRLSQEINKTYIAYGVGGAEGQARQSAQDLNADNDQSSSVNRALSKANGLYRNDRWDLCDGCGSGAVKLEDVPVEALPENMRSMTMDERKAYVAEMQKKREEIQSEINRLAGERELFVAAKLAELGEQDTFGQAMIETVREQAGRLGYTFTR